MKKETYKRQTGIFNPLNQNINITLIGAGSVGSFIALNLAKLGFCNIEIIDFDVVEEHNLPNQFYRIKDIGKPKVEALKDIVSEFTGFDLTIRNEKITKDSYLELDENRIYVVSVDNMEARKTIYSILKETPLRVIDCGMGGEGYTIQIFKMDNESDLKKYEHFLSQKFKDLPCGFQTIIYNILSIASETCNILKRIDKKQEISDVFRREMTANRIVSSDKRLI